MTEYSKKDITRLFKDNQVEHKDIADALGVSLQTVWRKTRMGLWTVADLQKIAEIKEKKLLVDFISEDLSNNETYSQLLFTIASQQRTIKMLMEDNEALKKMLK